MAHPLRMQILMLLDERVASPNELAKELQEPLGNVSYHVRTLADFGLVKLVRKRPRRGAIEHFYRAVTRPTITDDSWSRLPKLVKRQAVGTVLEEVAEDITDSATEGAFDQPDMHLSRTPLVLDEQGWQELAQAVAQLVKGTVEIEERSKKRLQEDRDLPQRAGTLVAMLFDRIDDGPERRLYAVDGDGASAS